MLNDIYYAVNGEKIYNPYLAFLRGASTSYHQFPEFKFMPGVFDLANIEPAESFAELCNQRAAQLRAKYDYLALAFSGGTDSFTVYDSFVRNNIHINHIVCNYMETACGHDKGVADWLVANHRDPRTKITIVDPNKIPPAPYRSEDWMYENRSVNYRYRHHIPSFDFGESCRLEARGKSYAMISGYEKPHLVLDNRQWYMTLLDRTIPGVLGIENSSLVVHWVDELCSTHFTNSSAHSTNPVGVVTSWPWLLARMRGPWRAALIISNTISSWVILVSPLLDPVPQSSHQQIEDDRAPEPAVGPEEFPQQLQC